MNWHVRDARTNFSKLVRMARRQGPQTVTLRGRPAVVVLSLEEYERLVAGKPSFVEHLLSGQPWDDEFVADVNQRNPTGARDIDL